MDGLVYYLQGVRPCVLLYKWKAKSSASTGTRSRDVFQVRMIDTHEIMEVSPRDLHLWEIRSPEIQLEKEMIQ